MDGCTPAVWSWPLCHMVDEEEMSQFIIRATQANWMAIIIIFLRPKDNSLSVPAAGIDADCNWEKAGPCPDDGQSKSRHKTMENYWTRMQLSAVYGHLVIIVVSGGCFGWMPTTRARPEIDSPTQQCSVSSSSFTNPWWTLVYLEMHSVGVQVINLNLNWKNNGGLGMCGGRADAATAAMAQLLSRYCDSRGVLWNTYWQGSTI